MKTILIAGGSGLVGSHLATYLHSKDYKIKVLSRAKLGSSPFPYFLWDVQNNYIEEEALANVDFIINLAGANIGEKRWSKKQKKAILESRVKSTQLLFDSIKNAKIDLKGYITASATGYYGAATSDKIFNEQDTAATDFLGNVCQQWEESSRSFSRLGIRTLQIRTGLVLTSKGGALEKITQPIKLGFGAVLGSGKQYMPWIHIADLCRIYELAIQNNTMKGAYNAVAPEHINNTNFTRLLAKHLGKKIWLPAIPSFFLKLLLGEMADLVLQGSRVSSNKIQDEGFSFLYISLVAALEDLF